MDYSKRHNFKSSNTATKSKTQARKASREDGTRLIPGHENYSVDRRGNVYSVRTGKRRAARLRTNGYVDIRLDGVSCYVHRLVAMAWLERDPEFNVVNHKNHRRDDNRVENLEWCTMAYNNADPGRLPGRPHGKSPVAGFIGDTPAVWMSSMAAAAEYVGVDPSTIRRCCDGVLKTAGKIRDFAVTWRRAGIGIQPPATVFYLPFPGARSALGMMAGAAMAPVL